MDAGTIIERCMGALELLSDEPQGLPLTTIAQELGIMKSGAHRLLNELQSEGFVAQDPNTLHYRLTMRLPTIGFRHLSATGIVEAAMPTVRELANATGELVRITAADTGMLTWLAKAQGARSRLRFDPDMGGSVRLHTTASGRVWLGSMDEAAALTLARASGLGNGEMYGPRTIQSETEFLAEIHRTRDRGYGLAVDEDESGMSAVAVNIFRPSETVALGTLSVAGPTVRLNQERLTSFVESLRTSAAALGTAWPPLH